MHGRMLNASLASIHMVPVIAPVTGTANTDCRHQPGMPGLGKSIKCENHWSRRESQYSLDPSHSCPEKEGH